MRRRAVTLLLLLVALAAPGCGSEDVEQVADDARQELREQEERLRERGRELERDVRERARRIRERIEEVLGDLEQVVPRAQETDPRVVQRGETIETFLTDILESVDGYWTRTLAENGMPEPRVSYLWVAPGDRRATRCGAAAGDDAAFYCPADDTIYIAQRFASALYEGVLRGLPGEGGGGARGDFGVAYVVAHEYAHNLQHEFGLFSLGRGNSTKPFELQADCMAGAWGSAVYAEGRFDDADVREALDTALAVGDFDISSENHHGTPVERRDAWLRGFNSGDPSACARYVPR